MRVKAVVTEVSEKYSVVESERMSACEGCHKSAEGCSVCSLMGSEKKISTKAINRIGAKVGDTVEIETESRRVMLYAAAVFMLPVLLCLAFYGVASLIGFGETARYVFLAAGFVISLFFVWIYSKFIVEKRIDAEIVEITGKKSE